MKDFGEFLELMDKSHNDIQESVRERTIKFISENPYEPYSEPFLEAHFETLEILARYHKWLCDVDQ